MTVFFTVHPDKEPTEAQAREAASATWTKWMGNSPRSFQEEGRSKYIETEWRGYLPYLRARAGEPLAETDYSGELSDYGDLMTVQEFKDSVESGGFIDYDGHGRPVKDGKEAGFDIYPSIQHLIPLDATHIMWFNR